jgi:hypothetical protein
LKQVRLTLKGTPEGDKCVLTLTANAVDPGAELGTVSHEVKADELLGNVSIANNFVAGAVGAAKKKGKGTPPARDATVFKTGRWKAMLSPSRRRTSSGRCCGRCTR